MTNGDYITPLGDALKAYVATQDAIMAESRAIRDAEEKARQGEPEQGREGSSGPVSLVGRISS